MAYDDRLARRIRDVLAGEAGLSEKRMFGGLAFLVDGRLAVAANGQGALMVRVDPERSGTLVSPPQVRPVEMRGRELAGWLHVDVEGLERDEDLERWVALGLGYARSLPPK